MSGLATKERGFMGCIMDKPWKENRDSNWYLLRLETVLIIYQWISTWVLMRLIIKDE